MTDASRAGPIVGIGNAIVDVISPCDDGFLGRMGIEKGVMQLVERARAEALYGAMDERTEAPGGSVGNTIAGLGALGLETAFVGRVADDGLGRGYAAALAEAGTGFPNPPVAGAVLPTSRSMIFVTPDGERSMNTYLGEGADLGPRDVDLGLVRGASILLLEGYLYDKPGGKAAFEAAAAACRDGGGRAGITLSDPFCVERHRADFRQLARGLDYVIGNRAEWEALYEVEGLDAALEAAAADCALVVCTRSEEGVSLVAGGARTDVAARAVTPVDATGAGDQFAAGFLYGLATGRDMEACGRMGCIAAEEVIGHVGARPRADIRARFAEAGLA